jgi:membrane-associated phospholipid phosphatase
MSNFIEKSNIDVAKNFFAKTFELINNYYFILIGLYLFCQATMIALHSRSSVDYKTYLFVLSFAAFTACSEIRSDVKWLPFLLLAIPFLMFVSYINVHGYAFWGKMLSWQMSQKIVINLNPIFKRIPFNDASFARIYKFNTLTWILRMVYNNGFVLPVLVPLYRAAVSKDFKKMLRYGLSGHILQVFLITPFYLMFHLQEVWYVLGQPDGLARHMTPQQAAGVTLNCFPSMHTSIAFAMFLLVMREKNKPFKYLWGFFCLSVIYSTMYLEIHWVIDIIGGLLLAYASVKIVDFILDKGKVLIQGLLNSYYYKRVGSTYISNYYLDSMR